MPSAHEPCVAGGWRPRQQQQQQPSSDQSDPRVTQRCATSGALKLTGYAHNERVWTQSRVQAADRQEEVPRSDRTPVQRSDAPLAHKHQHAHTGMGHLAYCHAAVHVGTAAACQSRVKHSRECRAQGAPGPYRRLQDPNEWESALGHSKRRAEERLTNNICLERVLPDG